MFKEHGYLCLISVGRQAGRNYGIANRREHPQRFIENPVGNNQTKSIGCPYMFDLKYSRKSPSQPREVIICLYLNKSSFPFIRPKCSQVTVHPELLLCAGITSPVLLGVGRAVRKYTPVHVQLSGLMCQGIVPIE
jgi:hypothetical protein